MMRVDQKAFGKCKIFDAKEVGIDAWSQSSDSKLFTRDIETSVAVACHDFYKGSVVLGHFALDAALPLEKTPVFEKFLKFLDAQKPLNGYEVWAGGATMLEDQNFDPEAVTIYNQTAYQASESIKDSLSKVTDLHSFQETWLGLNERIPVAVAYPGAIVTYERAETNAA